MQHQQTPTLEMIARRGRGLSRISGRFPSYLTTLRRNPTWLPMFVLARWMPARRAHWLTAKAVSSSSPTATMFTGVTCESAVQGLRRDGLYSGLNLPKQICADIASFAGRNSCFGSSDRKLEFMPYEHRSAEQRHNRAIFMGSYFEKALECDAVLAVQRDTLVWDIARQYLGGQARVVGTRIWWTFPTQRNSEADQLMAPLNEYHFDLHDWRMLKFFFYLNPVDEGTGPHVYIRGSHRRRALRHQFTPFLGHPAEDVLRAYGAGDPVIMLGDAGFGFVEDPFGFHMAKAAERAPRLAMEIAFGVSQFSLRRFHA